MNWLWGREIVILDRVVKEKLTEKVLRKERHLRKSIPGRQAGNRESLKLDLILRVQRTATAKSIWRE